MWLIKYRVIQIKCPKTKKNAYSAKKSYRCATKCNLHRGWLICACSVIIFTEKSQNGFNPRSENLHCRTLFYGKIGKKVLELYTSKIVDAPTLNRKNISWLVNKFCQTGTMNNLPHHRTHTTLTQETLAMVSSVLSEMQNESLRRVAKEQNVSYSTAQRATYALQLHPYRIRVIYELWPLDPINVYITVTSFSRIYAYADATNLTEWFFFPMKRCFHCPAM